MPNHLPVFDGAFRATRTSRIALVGLTAWLWTQPALAQKARGQPAPRAAASAEKAPPKASEPAEAAPTASPGAGEKGVQGQGKAAAAATATGAPVVATEEGKEGVKTYKFGAVEVEGRLRSPQLIYFLRRVRAEFRAGDLGHRSFLPELSDTARKSTFR